MLAVERCRAEQALALAHLAEGSEDPLLTMVWLMDWIAEEHLRTVPEYYSQTTPGMGK